MFTKIYGRTMDSGKPNYRVNHTPRTGLFDMVTKYERDSYWKNSHLPLDDEDCCQSVDLEMSVAFVKG